MSMWRRRRDAGEGSEMERKYIPWGVNDAEILRPDALPGATSAKDIHWNSSFLQPSTDSWGKGRHSLLRLLSDVRTHFTKFTKIIYQISPKPRYKFSTEKHPNPNKKCRPLFCSILCTNESTSRWWKTVSLHIHNIVQYQQCTRRMATANKTCVSGKK